MEWGVTSYVPTHTHTKNLGKQQNCQLSPSSERPVKELLNACFSFQKLGVNDSFSEKNNARLSKLVDFVLERSIKELQY